MPSSKEFLNIVLNKLDSLDNINYKQMMGEYIIYYNKKITAYVCDNHLFIKATDKAKTLINDYILKPPYENAKDMIFIEDINKYDDDFFEYLFKEIYDELPSIKKKAKK